MATKYKTAPKAELIAIYRLEFYKKQRNWKFCKDVCKQDDPEPSKLVPESEPQFESEPQPEPEKLQGNNWRRPSLNETYSIDKFEDEPNCEADTSALNNAFLENDSDKMPTTPPDPDTPVAWPEPVRAPEGNFVDVWTETEPACAEGDGGWARAEHAWQTATHEFASELGEASHYSALWESDRGWPAAAAYDGAWQPAPAAARLLRDCDLYTTQESCLSQSLESVSASQFLRGASDAPHSSEIELATHTEGAQSPRCVSWLSPQQLAARVALHAAALRDLMREARLREQQRALSSLSMDHRTAHCDERPTRDHGTSRPPRPHYYASHQDLRDPLLAGSLPSGLNYEQTNSCRDPEPQGLCCDPLSFDPPVDPFTECSNIPSVGLYYPCREGNSLGSFGDPFLAGSFRNVPEVGRGRGRLRKERVIGIGMGRPYRL